MATFDYEVRHPTYSAWLPKWAKMRDCFLGDEAVKGKGEEYLSRPSGMNAAAEPMKAYEAYVGRAEVPDLVAPTVRGLAGVIHRKPATYDLPSGLKPLLERSTVDFQPLDAAHRRVTREVLAQGRVGILTDAPKDGGTPFLAIYNAEAILDWDTAEDGKLNWLVLDESGYRRTADGSWDHEGRWRVCELVEGLYVQTVYVLESKGRWRKAVAIEKLEPVDSRRARLTEIPFVFVNANQLSPQPDEVPLYGVAKAQLSIYRLDADYRQSLYLTAQPTPVAIGVEDKEHAPKFIGASAIWNLPVGGDAKMLEFTGNGIAAMRVAMEDDYRHAIMAGAALLSEEQGAAESGEALRIRRSSQTATITSIAQTVGAGIERALRFAATMLGQDPLTVAVKPNLDFAETRLAAQEKTALVDAWLKGAISRKTLFWNLQRGEVIPEDRTYEEESAMIDDEAPGLGALGMGGGGGFGAPGEPGANDDGEQEGQTKLPAVGA